MNIELKSRLTNPILFLINGTSPSFLLSSWQLLELMMVFASGTLTRKTLLTSNFFSLETTSLGNDRHIWARAKKEVLVLIKVHKCPVTSFTKYPNYLNFSANKWKNESKQIMRCFELMLFVKLRISVTESGSIVTWVSETFLNASKISFIGVFP